jgi:hypothetical protein
VLVDNSELAPQGCGEPAVTTMGAVVANAIHDDDGVRLFTLAMTPARIREAPSKKIKDPRGKEGLNFSGRSAAVLIRS